MTVAVENNSKSDTSCHWGIGYNAREVGTLSGERRNWDFRGSTSKGSTTSKAKYLGKCLERM